MALDLGTLSVDITANTSELKKGEREVSKSTSRINESLKSVDMQATRTATKGLKNVRHAAGQLGFQVQDVAVQLQSGTNAMVVLGQQGSQIASIFGPAGAVVGAFIAVGSAIVGSLLPSVFKTKDATIELEEAIKSMGEVASTVGDDDIDVLSEKLIKLAKSSEALARVEIAKGIVDAGKAIEASSQLIEESFSDQLDSVFSLRSGVKSLSDLITTLDLGKSFDLGALVEQEPFGQIAQLVSDISVKFKISKDEAIDLAQVMSVQIGRGGSEAAKNLSETLSGLALKYQKTNPDLVEFASSINKQARSIQDSAEVSSMLAKALEDLDGAIEETGNANDKATDKVSKYIKILEIQAGALGKAGEALAEYEADVIGATGEDKKQIVALKEKIRLFKEQKAEEERSKKQAKSGIEKLELKGESPADKAKRELDEEIAAIQEGRERKLRATEEFHALEIDAHMRFNEKMDAIKTASNNEQLRVQLEGANNMATGLDYTMQLMRKAGKEGTAISKAIFLAQKAVAVQQILLSTQLAANAAGGQAAAAGGGILGYFGTKKGILASGYASAGLVAGMSIGESVGAFENGGIVGGNSFSGDNLIANVNSGEMILNSGQQRRLFAMANGSASGSGSQKITVINNGTPMVVESSSITRDEVMLIVNDATSKTESTINKSLSSGRGRTAQALQSGFRAERRI